MAKKKINFKQPKYILPVIVLPFLVFLNFVMQGFFKEDTQAQGVALEEKQEINTEIPEPSDKSKEGLSDKFDSYLDNFKDKQEYSAIQTLDEEEAELNDEVGGSLYSEEEIRTLDSLNNLRGETQRLREQQQATARRNEQNSRGNEQRNNNQSRNSAQGKSTAELEKEAFIEQMRIIDSIQSPEKYIKEEKTIVNQDSINAAIEKSKEKTFLLSNKRQNNLFNANIRGSNESEIKAILDEGLTVYQGSRVRIRLLTDVFIDEHLLEKGQYLYGIVSGFSAQRVQVTISSVMLGEKVYPINVTVYNNDGLPGFYVPDSKFREIANQLGTNMVQNSNSLGQQSPNTSTGNPDAEKQKFMFDMINSAYRTASTTVKNVLNKNKAHLKYNTVVYLVNENEK